jgi:hypothetical protein
MILLPLANVARSAFDAVRFVVQVGALTGISVVEMHPLMFALVSACSGVLLASGTVFKRNIVRSSTEKVRPAPVENVFTVTPDDCGHSIFFTIKPQSLASVGNGRKSPMYVPVANVLGERGEEERRKRQQAEADLLAASYSQFSLVDMTFETDAGIANSVPEPVKLVLESKAGSCVIEVAPVTPGESETSVTFSSISAPVTPLPGTPRGSSSASSACGSTSQQKYVEDWSPPQAPILIVRGYRHRMPVAKAAAPVVLEKTFERKMHDASSSTVTQHSGGSKCAIVTTVRRNQVSRSKALGSQLVEMSLEDDRVDTDIGTRRHWNLFAPWTTAVVESQMSARRQVPTG